MIILKMINAYVVVENKLWNTKIKEPNKYIKKKIKKIFKFNSLKKERFSLTILLTDNSKMKYLNKKFRNKNKITEVLSFPNLNIDDFKKTITILSGKVSSGFQKLDAEGQTRFILLPQEEVFGGKKRNRRLQRTQVQQAAGNLDDLLEGDHVVHLDYGIGRYNGL